MSTTQSGLALARVHLPLAIPRRCFHPPSASNDNSFRLQAAEKERRKDAVALQRPTAQCSGAVGRFGMSELAIAANPTTERLKTAVAARAALIVSPYSDVWTCLFLIVLQRILHTLIYVDTETLSLNFIPYRFTMNLSNRATSS